MAAAEAVARALLELELEVIALVGMVEMVSPILFQVHQ
jgi:hypothetical protein